MDEGKSMMMRIWKYRVSLEDQFTVEMLELQCLAQGLSC